MSDFGTEPDLALQATLQVTSTGGVQVNTTGVTLYPAPYDLRIPQGSTWDLYVSWYKTEAPQDFTGGTATLIARTEAGGSALVNLTLSSGITYTTGAKPYLLARLTAAQTAALDFTRAKYHLSWSRGGTVVPLLEGAVDLERGVMA